MQLTAVVAGALLIGLVLWETFETLVLPRRVARRLRVTRAYFRAFWGGWSAVGRRHPGPTRENYLSVFAPLSLLILFVLWAGAVIVGFALIQWGLDTPIEPGIDVGFATDLYMSATTFVTLGLGDVAPASAAGRAITAIEAGAGFAFLALSISYLPVLYQAFSRREVAISMLDQWAGSPPTAVELLRRAAKYGDLASVNDLLAEWERWSAELLESHLSYPILAYFRSQHDEQSWLAALTSVLDASAVVLAGVDGVSTWQARRTFAISRHAVVDLTQIFRLAPASPGRDRLEGDGMPRVRQLLETAGIRLDTRAEVRIAAYREMYEPYVHAMSHRLQMPLPPFVPAAGALDDWQRSAWSEPG